MPGRPKTEISNCQSLNKVIPRTLSGETNKESIIKSLSPTKSKATLEVTCSMVANMES